jgi:hypothetical protein
MIIYLDSNFRNKNVYPSISDFVIPINITPSSQFNDNRNSYSVEQNILFSFKYISNILNLNYTLISSNSIMINYNFSLSSHLYIIFQNIITGFLIQETTTLHTAIIDSSQLMPTGLYCTLNNSISIPTLGLLNLINPTSFSINNQIINFLIYGYSYFNFIPTPGYSKDYGVNINCTLVNLTKNWKINIKNYNEMYRIVNISQKKIDKNDYFIFLNNSDQNEHFESLKILNFYMNSIYKYDVIEKNFIDYIENEIFKNNINNIEILFKNNKLNLLHPGQNINVLQEIELISLIDINRKIKIIVLEINDSLQIEYIPNYYHLMNQNYLFFFITKKEWIPFYSLVIKINTITNLIYIEKPYSSLLKLGYIKPNFYEYGGLLLIKSMINNLSLTLANPILTCYSITLASLTLPNLPVKGYNALLSFFPYVYVNFGNVTNTSESSNFTKTIGAIASNDPNLINAQFICPIANVKNPLINQFITIFSNQVVKMKLNLQEDLRFQVYLPNGQLLSYCDVYGYNYINNELVSSNENLNSSLNLSYKYLVYPGINNNYITATFTLSVST